MSIFDTLQKGMISKSADETQSIAASLAKALPINQVLKLSGTLGTGKTTFVQGLAKAWQITETVKSPTFNLYSIHPGSRQLIHLDAYRLNNPSEAESLLIEEFLEAPYCLAVEWPEKVDGWMEDEAWLLQFSIQKENEHHIKLEAWPSRNP
jgi:tRNA threonylcarbamoyladenosine biosynthesis protein TsaE|tara:strand:+ start:256 stop:708 length:453 start_codon:yes stop_codon:yes gene_type:complete